MSGWWYAWRPVFIEDKNRWAWCRWVWRYLEWPGPRTKAMGARDLMFWVYYSNSEIIYARERAEIIKNLEVAAVNEKETYGLVDVLLMGIKIANEENVDLRDVLKFVCSDPCFSALGTVTQDRVNSMVKK